jgi:hypothetical protein
MVASASEDGTVKLWKASDGSSLRSIAAHPGGVLAARFGPDGRIVTAGRDNKVKIWDTSGKNLLTPEFKGDLPTRVTFTDDGKVIGSDWTGKVFAWDAKTGKSVGELEATPPPLAERVKQDTIRMAQLQAELDRAITAQIALDAEVKAAEERGDEPAKIAAAKKKAADAMASVNELKGKLDAAKTSLAKWSAALKSQAPVADARKVSRR